jgi:hypothetical protein
MPSTLLTLQHQADSRAKRRTDRCLLFAFMPHGQCGWSAAAGRPSKILQNSTNSLNPQQKQARGQGRCRNLTTMQKDPANENYY